jgi:putative membrane protein
MDGRERPSPPDPALADAIRRTYLAQERTLLAWWRSGLAAVAVSLAIGRLIPALMDADPTTFGLLGVAFGVIGLALFVIGAMRDRHVQRALHDGRFVPLGSAVVWIVSGAFAVLSIATVLLIVDTAF